MMGMFKRSHKAVLAGLAALAIAGGIFYKKKRKNDKSVPPERSPFAGSAFHMCIVTFCLTISPQVHIMKYKI